PRIQLRLTAQTLVYVEVGSDVAPPPIGQRLDERGPFAGAGSVHRLGGRLVHEAHGVAVDAQRGDLVGRGMLVEGIHGLSVEEPRVRGVEVIIGSKDGWWLAPRGEVHRLEEDALLHRAVAEEDDRHAIDPLKPAGQRGPDAGPEAAANQGGGAEQPDLLRDNVHRPPAPERTPGGPPEYLGGELPHVAPLGQVVAVGAMRAKDIVVRTKSRAAPARSRLLADIQVSRADDLTRLHAIGDDLFEAPNA